MANKRVVPIHNLDGNGATRKCPGLILRVFGRRFQIETSIVISEIPAGKPALVVPIRYSRFERTMKNKGPIGSTGFIGRSGR